MKVCLYLISLFLSPQIPVRAFQSSGSNNQVHPHQGGDAAKPSHQQLSSSKGSDDFYFGSSPPSVASAANVGIEPAPQVEKYQITISQARKLIFSLFLCSTLSLARLFHWWDRRTLRRRRPQPKSPASWRTTYQWRLLTPTSTAWSSPRRGGTTERRIASEGRSLQVNQKKSVGFKITVTMRKKQSPSIPLILFCKQSIAFLYLFFLR